MSNDSNGSAHERGPQGTFSDNASGSMWSGGRLHTTAEQIAAGINATTDRTTAEIIMGTTLAGGDETGGVINLKGAAIVFFIYLSALLITLSLFLIGVPDTRSISFQYVAVVSVGLFIFGAVESDSNSLRTKLAIVGSLIIAQSVFAIYHLSSTAFAATALTGLVMNTIRIAIGVGIIRGYAAARLAFVAVVIVSALMSLFAAKFSAVWSYVLLFRSPLGFPSAVFLAFLLFRRELRSTFK
ncbi:hypothetical protein [Paraburkholderia silvatlantica]|uniref:Uncharacterized protein n=1 Tax=Paraburkholderia silvatlantica TaxID=321895 RepID=A0ABR6FQF3_9BURK|nr:hypothetical protein [Paraburkholderia silvatlantica]MBB2929661.1 hypothetical protein [Paraburkholderia silvatlantica]PVY35040.1 hypothetical protein C7411_106227 [Paraburkholderia silvatlantica]PXW39450.1 hypothetical protein C7413_106227 [Paraburkholderia silvatlantica]